MTFKIDESAGGSPPIPSGETDFSPGMLAAGLALNATIQAGQQSDTSEAPAERAARSGPRTVSRSRIKRRPARVQRRRSTVGTHAAAFLEPVEEPRDTNSELRDWLKENASLLSNASLLISISAIALKALPAEGVLNPYIQALIFAAALTLLVEMHNQWPDDLQLHMFRRATFPHHHSRRMTAFALLMQLATVLFAAWAALTNPLILFPLAAFAIFMAFRQWYFRRFQGWPARIVGVVALVLVLLFSELLMAIIWASFTGGQVTIEFGDRPVT